MHWGKRVVSRLLILSTLAVGSLIPGAWAQPVDAAPSSDEVLAAYLENNRQQRLCLRDISMTVDIEAELPDLRKHGVMRAFRKVSELGKITYKVLGFQGDTMVKKDVIARYIEAEIKSADALDRDAIAINADNYRFRYWGRYGSGDWTLHLFEIRPKAKRTGLYNGWLWIHANTRMPVRESGRLVRNPSVFLKRVDFVKDYKTVDGIAVPTRIESEIRTRLVGTAAIKVTFSDISFDGEHSRMASWSPDASPSRN